MASAMSRRTVTVALLVKPILRVELAAIQMPHLRTKLRKLGSHLETSRSTPNSCNRRLNFL